MRRTSDLPPGGTPGLAHPSSSPALQDGLAQLGLALEDRAQKQLQGYLDLISRWNRVYNLTAVRNPSDMLTHHLLDSLAAWPALNRHLGPQENARILDVGSGAGLPGVVLAIAEPRWSVTCVDAVAKKAGFIRQVAAELGLGNLQAVHARVEELPAGEGHDVVTSRAFSSLGDFVSLTGHLLKPEGCWMAMKGRVPEDELAALPSSIEVFHVEPLTVPGLDARRCLVWMRKKAT